MIRTLIVEDEPDAAARLQRMLARIDKGIEVVGILDSVESSVRWLREHPPPHLMMLDIQLGDGISFDIFKEVEPDSFVIFTTAYDDYAIRAFEINSIDYLLKPISEEKLTRSVKKFRHLFERGERLIPSVDQLQALINNGRPAYKQRFLVSAGERLRSIDISEVAFFYAMEKSTWLCTNENIHYALDDALDHLESMVDPNHFFRISRSHLVNIRAIANIETLPKSRLRLRTLPDAGVELIVSTNRTAGFRRWLDK